MSRPPSLNLAFTLSLLTLAACGEATTPTQPEMVEDRSPLAPSFALAKNTWTKRARLPDLIPSRGLAAGVVNNSAGQPILYVFGGSFEEFRTGVVRVYSYAKNTWRTSASELDLSYSNGVGRIGGKLYISGGYPGGREGFCCEATQRALYAYDPVADRLTRKADMPRQTALGVTGVINGKLYVLSGTCADETPPVFDCEVESNRRLLYRYDPATDAWTTLGPAPRPHPGGAGGVINGKFYVAGGGSSNLDVYDPITNTWRALAPMPSSVSGGAGAVLQNRLYVIGGSGPRGHRNVVAYNPVTNTWQTKAALLTGRVDLAAASLVTIFGNPKILAVGGYDGTERPGINELYTP